MTTVFDYLTWRGDLTLEQDGLNPVDALILSCLSYLHFDGIIPEGETEKSPTIAETEAAFSTLPDCAARQRVPEDGQLLKRLAESRRFAGMRLSHYVSQFDPEEQKQFSAVTIALGNGEAFVSFRGTDNTLVGWKEDFNMSFLDSVPAQRAAAVYLQAAAESFHGKLWVGGHSKGGNLAVFAASSCSGAQPRILGVFNHDGPGFDRAFLERAEYRSILDKIHTFIPQSSVVGMLLEHEETYTVIHSGQRGILQHDPYTWEVLGPDFVRLDSITSSSRVIDQTMKRWVAEMDVSQRERFFDALYEILSATNVQTFSELTSGWLKNARAVLHAVKGMDEETRKIVSTTLTMLFSAAKQSVPRPRLPARKVKVSKASAYETE